MWQRDNLRRRNEGTDHSLVARSVQISLIYVNIHAHCMCWYTFTGFLIHVGTVSPGTVSHQLGSLMDWFSTALDLAGIKEPDDRIIDGISLLPLLVNGTHTDRYEIRIV